MRSKETNLYEFLSGGKSLFVIPVFQRNYDWEIEQCDRLITDIRNICETNKNHFIGTICFKRMDSGETIIIDGQQRITSIMLLSKALHDVADDQYMKQYIDNEILKTKYTVSNKPRVKLKPIKKDEAVYNKLIFEDNVNETTFTREERRSNIYKNYEFFVKRVKELKLAEYTDRQISDAIEKLEVVELQIEDENPQVVFESLNSTGLDLTKADLIRNFVLMPLSAAEQDEMYTNYWLPMENVFRNAEEVESFVLHFMIYEKKTISLHIDGKRAKLSKKNVYNYFKKTYSQTHMQDTIARQAFFKKIRKYSAYYKQFIFDEGFIPQNELEEKFFVLFHVLNSWDAALILLYVYDLIEKGYLNSSIIPDVLDILISFALRSAVCKKLGAKGLNDQTCILSVQKLESIFKPGDDFIDLLYKVLTSFKGGSAFPRNADFRAGLLQSNLYGSLKATTKYLLYSINKYYNPKEAVSFQDGTIEHILPQILTQKQKEYLNAMDEQTMLNHENIVHTLGNLTLTGYNAELSNDIFEKKKDVYKDSNYTITKNLANYTQWTGKEIAQRSTELANVALKIWPLPPQYETRRVDTGVTYSLDSDFSILTGKKPNEFTLDSTVHTTSSWKEMLLMVLNIVYQYSSDAFYDVMELKQFKNRILTTSIPVGAKDIKQYLSCPPKNTEDCLRMIKYALELCDDYYKTEFVDEFSFTIKCDDNNEIESKLEQRLDVNMSTGEVVEVEKETIYSDNTNFFIGDFVEHKSFGRGVVKELTPATNGDVYITIKFDNVGEKKFIKNIIVQMNLLRKIIE